MRSHADIVKAAGDDTQVARERGVSVHTVRSWIQRDSIPPEHWAAFARRPDTSLDELAQYAAANPRRRPTPTEQAAAA